MKLRSPAPQRLLRRTIHQLAANPSSCVLDVGAGSVVEKNRRAGYLDLAASYERLTRQRGYFGLDVAPGANVMLVGNAHELPIADQSLDAVLMLSVLEHLGDPARAVNEVWRVLKVGGLYFSYAPFYHPYHASPQDYFRFTQEGYRHLLRAFGRVEIVSGGNYIAVLNDALAYACGASRAGRMLARVVFEFPLSLFFRALDHRLSTRVATGFAALAVK